LSTLSKILLSGAVTEGRHGRGTGGIVFGKEASGGGFGVAIFDDATGGRCVFVANAAGEFVSFG